MHYKYYCLYQKYIAVKTPTLNIQNSPEDFVEEICNCIYVQYLKSIEKSNKFTFVLSGGNTPKAVFTYLAENYLDRINWGKVYFFWLDERCTAPNNLDNNYFMAHKYLLSKLKGIGGVYRMKGELDRNKAASLYSQELKSFFGGKEISFDFIILGMGTDGHIASIFPGLERTAEAKVTTFYTKRRYNGYYRLSLGLDVINASTYKLLILKGAEKIKVFKKKNNFNLLPKDYVNFSHVIYLDNE